MSYKLESLTLNDNSELESILREKIESRNKLHGWPLSSVELIETESGKKLIYKSQIAQASVERKFYEQCDSPLLLKPVYSSVLEECDVMLIPYWGITTFGKSNLSAEKVIENTEKLSREIQKIKNYTYIWDLSAHSQGIGLLEEIIPYLAQSGFAEEEQEKLRYWMKNTASACWNHEIGLAHGDLTGDNILLDGDEVRVIDWQRPFLAPLPLETALALRCSGLNCCRLSRYISPEFESLSAFMMAYWYAWAYKTCLHIPFVINTAVKYAREIISDNN